MIDILTAIFMLLGAVFMLLASIGILKMPDVYNRLQTTTKAISLGIGALMVANIVYLREEGAFFRATTIVLFFFATAPVAAHIIGRAAHFVGVKMWKGTVIDEMSAHYDEKTHMLDSPHED